MSLLLSATLLSTGSSAPYTYTIVPALGSTNPTGLELPYFSFVQQIRPGGSAVLDEMLVGCAVKGWKLSIKNSPGRASAMVLGGMRDHRAVHLAQRRHAAGRHRTPHEFNAGMITALTINGINYLSGGSGNSSFPWMRPGTTISGPGFFPGSGTQDGYQIQGRFEWGDRAFAVQFVVRVQSGSTEYSNLINLTTGHGHGHDDARHQQRLHDAYPEHGLQCRRTRNTDGIVTLQITGVQLYNPTNGSSDDDYHHAA